MYSFFSLRGILIIILTIVGTLLTLRKAKFGLMAFIILLFARDGFLMHWFPPVYLTLHFPMFFGVLTFVSWFFHREEYSFKFPFQMWLMVLFFVVICLSRIMVGSYHLINKPVEEFFKMCILFFLIVNVIKDRRDLTQIIWVLVIINAFVTLFHYYNYKTGWESIFVLPNFRGLNRNDFGAALVAAAGLAYCFMRGSTRNFIKLFLFFCLTVFISGVILTYSRGGAVALAATLFISVLLDRRKFKPIILFSILFLLIGARVSEKYFEHLENIKYYQQDPSSMGRVATNQAAINMLKLHPFFGIGAGNFGSSVLDYTPEELRGWVAPGKNIHNIVLQVAGETGIIGLTIFILLVGKSFIDVIRIRKICYKKDKLIPTGYTITALGIAFFGYFLAKQFCPGAYYSYIYIFIPLIVGSVQVFKNSADYPKKAISSVETEGSIR